MSDLKEIEARLAERYIGRGGQLFTSEEVRPLVAEVKRLKALCGRALKELREDEPSSIGPERKPLMAELKKAAKK